MQYVCNLLLTEELRSRSGPYDSSKHFLRPKLLKSYEIEMISNIDVQNKIKNFIL